MSDTYSSVPEPNGREEESRPRGRGRPDAAGAASDGEPRCPEGATAADGFLVLDAAAVTSDPALEAEFVPAAHRILAELVADGAPLGWVEPPSPEEIAELLGKVLAAASRGDAALRAVYLEGRLVALGYWLRYARATNLPHADIEKIAVAASAHGRGLGRALTTALVRDAERAGIEVLTLDARGDNHRALNLYRSLGFREYGHLPDFVAIGEQRWDKVFWMLDFRLARGGEAPVGRAHQGAAIP
ncbi:GNAT family N-acetyltransferase [Streptomyces sp. NA04227]|uniref:GNAT family N-acetyltransferase n=1 Tax=Streptomyces sp. NA04227 TaxID=2742136 RepID=UPI001590DAC8|nr:N-acetyltransferase [Streptomyces sp. NA04227]QKW08774.1 GNAT family N-acetyltransferase [Streptomyces sp. NA04227]